MQANRYGHIDMRVPDLDGAIPFYTKLLPALGFEQTMDDEEWRVFRVAGELPAAPFFSITEDTGHVPNGNRVAFWCPDRESVDRLAALAEAAGGKIESGPRLCTEYSDSYYACFFADPCGNLLELYFRTD